MYSHSRFTTCKRRHARGWPAWAAQRDGLARTQGLGVARARMRDPGPGAAPLCRAQPHLGAGQALHAQEVLHLGAEEGAQAAAARPAFAPTGPAGAWSRRGGGEWTQARMLGRRPATSQASGRGLQQTTRQPYSRLLLLLLLLLLLFLLPLCLPSAVLQGLRQGCDSQPKMAARQCLQGSLLASKQCGSDPPALRQPSASTRA